MRNNFDENIDKTLEQFFKNETEKVSISDNSFYKIKSRILREKERGFFNMKFGFLKPKTVIAAGLICMATIGTIKVGASSGELSWSGGSDPRADITQFPTENIVDKRVGFSPKYVESFSNGFKFESFNSSHEDLKNDVDSIITSTKSADFKYTRDGSVQNQRLDFSAEKIDEQYLGDNKFCDAPIEYNGVKIYYHACKRKGVPEGYKVTEEEQKMIDDGSLQVAYGLDKIEEDNTQSVSWYEDGIEYNILNWNYDELTKDQIIDMAKEVIDK